MCKLLYTRTPSLDDEEIRKFVNGLDIEEDFFGEKYIQ